MRGQSPFRYRPRTTRQQRTFSALNADNDTWRDVFVSAEREHEALEADIHRRPLYMWLGLVLVMAALFFFQLFSLQIVQGERYVNLANGNRLRERVTYAERGMIHDRHGKVLARNQASYQLVVRPHRLPEDKSQRDRVLQTVARLIKEPVKVVKQRSLDQPVNAVEPTIVKERLTQEQALAVKEQLPSLPGFVVDAIPVRDYMAPDSLSHVIGYTGRVTEGELQDNPQLSPIDFVGKEGVELQYDATLRGTNGIIQTEVDAMGRPLKVLNQRPAVEGGDVTLTIDLGLQRHLTKAIKRQMKKADVERAAGAAIDPQTGEVLASVSLPAFDNEWFAKGITKRRYNQLINNPLEPLHNKVTAGGYPAGSIIKPMHISAALQEGVVNEDTIIEDKGKIVIQSPYDPTASFTFRGWRPEGLGPMDARSAVAMSSDIYFYTTGGGFGDIEGLGVERLTEYYRLFGLGTTTGIDLPSETDGRIPTPQWLEKNYGRSWSVGDTYNISIGQGDLLVSPLQMAMATAAVANGGKLLEPSVLKPDGPLQPTVIRKDFIDQQYLKIAREGMAQVIGGTTCTCTFADVPVKVAGKSGTAETDPNNPQRKPHAWYTAFAPYNDPEVVFVVLLEEGEGGSQFAAPAIAETMEWYFRGR